MFDAQLTKVELTETTLQGSLAILPDNPFFVGHFDNKPILPGVTQMVWLGQWLEQYFNLQITKVDQVKFTHPVTPNSILDVELTWLAERQLVSFKLSVADQIVCQGKVKITLIH